MENLNTLLPRGRDSLPPACAACDLAAVRAYHRMDGSVSFGRFPFAREGGAA